MGQLLTAGGGNGILGNKSSTSLMYTNIDTPTASDSIKNLLSLLNVPVTYSNGTTGNEIAFLKWGGTDLAPEFRTR